MSATPPGVPPVPAAPAVYAIDWATRLVQTLNAAISKINNGASLTLAAGATTTTMTDGRLSAFSVLAFMPTSANAAAIQASIWVPIATQGKGHAVIHHTNTANVDQTFRVGILS